jgi:hypothetical protein
MGDWSWDCWNFFCCCCNRVWNRKQANSPACAGCRYRSFTNGSCNSANACSITNDHTNACGIANDHTSPSGLTDDVRREHTNTDNAAEENTTHAT